MYIQDLLFYHSLGGVNTINRANPVLFLKDDTTWATIKKDRKRMELYITRVISEAVNWLMSIVVALILAAVINIFVCQPTEVLGSSMEPTLQNGEMVFLSKLPHTFHLNLNYGDIVVIDSRVQYQRSWTDDLMESPVVQFITRTSAPIRKDYWIKRLIGKPGDVLEIKDGRVFRNGHLVDEPYLKEPMNAVDQRIVVPLNAVFLMGDNRNNSFDCRAIGPVPLDHVLGKMIFS